MFRTKAILYKFPPSPYIVGLWGYLVLFAVWVSSFQKPEAIDSGT